MGKNVMIIPEGSVAVKVTKAQSDSISLDLLQQNWLWAKQWKEAVPSDRETVTVPINGDIDRDFIPAVRRAATQAGGKYVILFTGHGSRDPNGGGGSNLIRRFQFDTVPEPGDLRLDNHARAITPDVLNFLDIAEQQNGKWVPKGQKMGTATLFVGQDTVDRLASKWRIIQAMRDEFQKNGVQKLIVLTCQVGNYPVECARFATLINLSTVFCLDFISSRGEDLTLPPDPLLTRSVILWATSTHGGDPPMDPFSPGWETWWKIHPFWTQLPNSNVKQFDPGVPQQGPQKP